MNKKFLLIEFVQLLVVGIVLLTCTAACSIGGYFIGTTNKSYKPKEDIKLEKIIVKGDYDWIDLDSVENTQEILTKAKSHFPVSFEVDNLSEYEAFFNTYNDFILLNLENQRNYLADVFDYPYLGEISLLIVDTKEKYIEKTDLNWEGDIDFSGYATFDNIIIFIPPDTLTTKDIIADLLSHELVHIYQFQSLNDYADIPLWFQEGMADYYSTQGTPFEMTSTESLVPSLSDLDLYFNDGDMDKVHLAYNISNGFYTYLAETNENKLLQVLRETRFSDFDETFTNIISSNPDELFDKWIDSLDT